MKITTTVLAVLSLGFAAAATAQDDIKINVPGAAPAAPAAPAATAAPAAFSEAQVLEELGWMAGKSTQLELFKLTPTQTESVLKGMSAAIQGKDNPYAMDKIGPAVQELVQRKQTEYLDTLKQAAAKEATAFFAKLKENKNVVELPSGLRYEIVQAGNGAYPKANETVKVHYVGKLINGTVFDSSIERKEPTEFPVDQVIPGWSEGIQKINKGGKIRLYVPANLAYGDTGAPSIPPGAALIFEVELLDIKATPGPASLGAPATK